MLPVSLLGVFPVGPENFLCALLHWQERGRFLPVWLPKNEGSRLLSRLNGWAPSRPDVYDALIDVIYQSTQGVSSVEVSSCHEGVFGASISMVDGAEIDVRVSDALFIALSLDMRVEVDESTLNQSSMWMSAHDALLYFDVEIADIHDGTDGEDGWGSTDQQADSDFEKLMRSLGIDEESFNLADPETVHDDIGDAGDAGDASPFSDEE